MSIRIGILGYGNLGRGVECAIRQNPDMELVAVFTRRNPEDVTILTETAAVCNIADAADWKDKIDVMILCGGSATDLPVQTPEYAKMFNVVDSFDTHAKIPEHFANVDAAAKEGGHIGIISVGWDPGMFSLNRLYANVVLPEGKDYTFWGKGVSQGHSDAVRRIAGVKDAKHFISEEELKANHSGIPHGGFVLRSGVTGWEKENKHLIEYSLKLDSNPEFTSSVILAYARAAYCLHKEGQTGCKTVFDIAPTYLSPKSAEELRAEML